MIGQIILKEPFFESQSLLLIRSQSFPQKMRLRLRVNYGKIILSTNSQIKPQEIAYDGGLHILQSSGSFSFSRQSKNITIDARLPNVWNSDLRDVWAETVPLSLDEIHEIDEKLGSGDVQFYWDIEAWGLIEPSIAAKYGMGSNFVHLRPSCNKQFIINRQDFVKNLLEPADLLRRMFIDVIFEPIGSLDKISDSKTRETFAVLLAKQQILIAAYSKFMNASSSDDYRSVISDVRLALENLNASDIHDALKKAYENIGIAEGAISKVSDEVSSVVTGQKGSKGSIDAVYKFACKLASHSKTEDNQNYTPKPCKHDAEFALLQAMNILNYLIRVLKRSNLRE